MPRQCGHVADWPEADISLPEEGDINYFTGIWLSPASSNAGAFLYDLLSFLS
jgi:hypothetical protein